MILQEIAATRDSPDDIGYDLLHDAAFPHQPVGRPILGTPLSVGSFTAADLKRFLRPPLRPRKHGDLPPPAPSATQMSFATLKPYSEG